MSTELTEVSSTTLSEITFDLSEESLQEMREQYLPLVVTDFDDSATINAIIEGHKKVKKVRTSIESRRKQLNSDALSWQRTVNATAKGLAESVQQIEDHLAQEREKVETEKARVKAEKEAAAQAILQNRVTLLAAVNGDVTDLVSLRTMPDEMFRTKLFVATKAFEAAELERIEAEKQAAERQLIEAEKRDRAEQLQKQLAAFGQFEAVSDLVDIDSATAEGMILAAQQRFEEADKTRQALEAARLKLEAEQQAELARRAEEIKQHQAELVELKRQQAERDQAERARLEAESEKRWQTEEAERLRLAEAARQQEDAERLAREEELKPVREQLVKLAAKVAGTTIPKPLEEYRNVVQGILQDAADRIRNLA